MRAGIIGGSIAGCVTGALLHRAGHDVTVFERSESGLVSRGAGILMISASRQDMTARGLLDGSVPACRVGHHRLVTRAAGTGQQRWLGDIEISSMHVAANGLSRGDPAQNIPLRGWVTKLRAATIRQQNLNLAQDNDKRIKYLLPST